MLHRLLHNRTPAQRQRAPRYLVRRGSTWHFRARLPRALAASLGRHEVWRSLGSDLPLARFCAALLGARIGDLWTVVSVTADDLDAVVNAWFQREVTKAKALFMDGSFAEAVRPADLTLEQVEEHHRFMVATDAEWRIEDLQADRRADAGAAGAREIAAATVPPLGHDALPDLRVLVMRLLGEIEEARIRWAAAGDSGFRPDVPAGATDGVLKALGLERRAKVSVPAGLAAAPTPHASQVATGRTLREAILRRIETYQRDNKPTDRMVQQTRSRLEILAEALGDDRKVASVTRDHLRPVVEALQDLPARWRASPKLGGGSMLEKAKRARALKLDPLDADTVKAHLAVWRSLFEDEGVEPSPLTGFKIRAQRRRRGQKRDGFTDSEVGTVFASALFQGSATEKEPYEFGDFLIDNWKFWACLIACFTGARISEIAQLRPTDVICREEGGQRIWVIRITEVAEDGEAERRLKNASSERVVPVHAELARIGLLRLAKQQNAAGASTLLPGCPKPVGGDAGKQLSKWMSEKFVVRLGIKRTGMGFHFFRHTLTTWLRAAEVPKDARKMLAGRSLDDGEGDSDDGYGTWTMATLHSHLHKITVPAEIRKIDPRRTEKVQGGEKASTMTADGT